MERIRLSKAERKELSPDAYRALGDLLNGAHPRQVNGAHPRQEINPGLAQKLEKKGLVDTYNHPSPYRTTEGQSIQWIRINQAGMAKYNSRPQ